MTPLIWSWRCGKGCRLRRSTSNSGKQQRAWVCRSSNRDHGPRSVRGEEETIHTGGTMRDRIQQLATAFPTLDGAAGVRPWDPKKLVGCACGPAPGHGASTRWLKWVKG